MQSLHRLRYRNTFRTRRESVPLTYAQLAKASMCVRVPATQYGVEGAFHPPTGGMAAERRLLDTKCPY